jgi:hypothetical protein
MEAVALAVLFTEKSTSGRRAEMIDRAFLRPRVKFNGLAIDDKYFM